MPQDAKIIQVFAASPSDVAAERQTLERVVQKLNLTIAPLLGMRVELVRWETHAYPDFGVDAQDVINRQIPAIYDLFIGILWGRFGTATARAGSGTEEEFDRALARHRAGEPVRLMIYFKDAPLPPSQLDPAQLASVFAFKAKVEAEGGLHWTFVDNFEELVELHLTRHLQDFQKSHDYSAGAVARSEPRVVVEPDEDGIIEYMEAYNEHFDRLIEVQERITAAIADLGQNMTERAEEINKAAQEGKKGDIPYIRRMATKTAEDMAQFVARMDIDTPIFATEFEAGFRAFINGVAASRDFESHDAAEQIGTMLDTVNTVDENLTAARGSVLALRDSVASLPRVTTVLNRAKRATVTVLDKLVREFDAGETLLREVQAVLKSHLTDLQAG